MITTGPKCGGKRIGMWLCDRDVGCTARPKCESPELRQPPLPFARPTVAAWTAARNGPRQTSDRPLRSKRWTCGSFASVWR